MAEWLRRQTRIPLRSRHLFSSEAQVQVLLVSILFLGSFVGDGTVTPYAKQCQAF